MESERLQQEISSESNEESHGREEPGRNCFFKCPITVEIITFGLFLADNLSDSITTNFILIKTCEVHFHYNKSICEDLGRVKGNASDLESILQPYSAVILTGMTFLSIFLPAIMTLFVGPWSDYNGRKPVLLVSALGYFFKFVLLGVFSWIPDLDPKFGLVAVLPVALTGGIINFITAVYSYISDITQEGNRAFRISILESFMYCANIVGLLIASYIFKACAAYAYVYVVTYGLCAFIILVVSIITYFFVPESVQNTESGKGLWHVFELKLFKETLNISFKRREGYRRAVIFLVIISLTIAISVAVGESNVLFLFTRLRFGWDVEHFNLWASVASATDFIGLLVGSVLLTKWLKLPDAIVGFVSFSLKSASAFYIAFVPPNAPNMMYYVGLIGIFGGLCGPASRAVLSKSVPKADLGKIFALTGSSEALFPLAVGPLYTFIYNYTINTMPSAFLLLTGSLFFLSCVFFIIVHFAQKTFAQTEFKRMENENESR